MSLSSSRPVPPRRSKRGKRGSGATSCDTTHVSATSHRCPSAWESSAAMPTRNIRSKIASIEPIPRCTWKGAASERSAATTAKCSTPNKSHQLPPSPDADSNSAVDLMASTRPRVTQSTTIVEHARDEPSRMTSLFDLYKIGVGPSSSHTMGPMTAAYHFAEALDATELLARTHRVQVDL